MSDTDIRWDPITQPRTSPNFASFPFKDLRAFATKVDRHQDPVSQFLWQEFRDPVKQEITSYVGTNSESKTPQEDLVNELNRIIHRAETIYDPARFAGVSLSEDSKSQVGKKLTGDRLASLNRLLLEDAYPAEIIRKASRKAAKPEFMNPVKPEPAAPEPEAAAEPYLLRLIILWLLTASCYGVQLLAFRDRQAEQEAREAAARNSELKAAGRLAAEIAHQLKNPLGIINNAIFSLQRGLRGSKHDFSEQIDIIKEEVERSDRIITQLMGYAQLSEGRVEKLSALEELDRALAEVFPPAASYATQIHRDYRPNLPALVMQRSHLSAALVNLLQNAREAVNGAGNIYVSAQPQGGNTMEIIVADDGPGIPPDKLGKIFEAYVTSKSKGTGLGLAIVKHNVELYGGTVTVESKLGKGSRFILLFPVRTFVK
jgi:signal transduction histidine kinase